MPTPIPARLCPRHRWLVFLIGFTFTVGLLIGAVWLWQRNRARHEWQKAQDALHRHDLSTAASCLERYLQYRPEEAPAWFLAARTARRLGRIADAESRLERCQQLAGITDATRLEWDLLRVQQGQLGETHVRLRMTIGPDHPDALLVLEALARGYVKCERLLDARQACDWWSEREPDHPWPWLWRGFIFERLGHFDKAAQKYLRAAELAPEDREIQLALGGLLARQRRPSAAVEHFELVLARLPEDQEALLGLAASRIEQGQSELALPLLERVSPDRPAGLLLRSKIALQRDDYTNAERWLRQAVASAPDDSESLYTLIQCLRAQGKEAEAGQLAPRLEQLGKDLRRLEELIKAVAQKPDEAALRHEAGVICLRIGRSDEGLRWLRSALRAGGDHRATEAVLAEYDRQHGDSASAATRRPSSATP